MYNLFYVESPLQLLSAISAVNKFNEHKAILIANLSHGDRVSNDTQILECIGNEWHKVYIQRSRKGKISRLIGLSLLRDIIKLGCYGFKYRNKINKYFIGEYRSIDMAILRCFLLPQETILLDDGSFTITAQNYHISKKISPYLDDFKYKLFRPLLNNLAAPNLYSFFRFDSTLLKGQVNYFEFEDKKKSNINKGDVYFFGAKFSENKFMHLADEIDVLSKVLKLYLKYDVFYVPHRDESLSKLDKISELGYKLKKLDKPAEIYFDETDVMPEIVISYYSTVLYTCHLRFCNVQLYAVDVMGLLLQKSTKINAKEIYKYYKELGIRLITV